MPVVGAPRETRGPEHLIVGGMYQGRPDDDLWVEGVVAANVSRVEVELTDGRRLKAPVYDAPAALGLDLKFFLVRTLFLLRTRPPEYGAPKVEIPELPVRAFSAYDARGRLLERLSPPAAPLNPWAEAIRLSVVARRAPARLATPLDSNVVELREPLALDQ
jgi:hypothetical protein